MGKICMISIYFRKIVYSDYQRVVSICKGIHNKTSIIFLSLRPACWILMQRLRNSSWWCLVVSAPDICALFVNVPCHKRILLLLPYYYFYWIDIHSLSLYWSSNAYEQQSNRVRADPYHYAALSEVFSGVWLVSLCANWISALNDCPPC